MPADGEAIRWRGSVGTMLGYLGILLHDPELSREALCATLEHRASDRLRTPNYARSEILLAALSLMQQRKGEAIGFLRDIEDVFRGGVAGSLVETPSKGYYPYTEIHASLAAVRIAFDLRRALGALSKDGSIEALALGLDFSALSPVLQTLSEKGRCRAWLEAAQHMRQRRVRPPSELHGFRKRSAELLKAVRSATESDTQPLDAGWLAELDALTGHGSALARAGSYSWQGLLDLAEARFWLGLVLALRRRPEASEVLAGAAPWGKTLFSAAPFADRADFARMEAILSLVMSSYLIEHALLNPLPCYSDRASFARLAVHHGRSAFAGDRGRANLVTALIEACEAMERN